MHRILLKEGSGVVEALKAIRGPLFGMFLVAIDLRQARVCDAGDRCPVSILLSRSEEYCERQVWGQAVGKRVRAENAFLYWLLPIAVASTFGFSID